jgi:hypothetical protein
MRRWLPILFALLFAACSGDDAAESVASRDATATVASAGADGVTFTSVPVGDLGNNHIQPPVSFSASPSIGGDHYPFWQNCGFYDLEAIEGAATHTMEHGAVWITYNADRVSDAELDELRALAAGNSKLLISAYDHPEKLVLSAWGVQHREDALSPSDAAVSEFITDWVDNSELPEAGVTCQEAAGFPPNDVRTLVADGSQVPAEYG